MTGLCIAPCNVQITLLSAQRRPLLVCRGFFGRPGRQAVDIAVEHAESGCDQYGVVNRFVVSTRGAGGRDFFLCNAPASLLHLAGNYLQRFHFVAEIRLLKIRDRLVDQIAIFSV